MNSDLIYNHYPLLCVYHNIDNYRCQLINNNFPLILSISLLNYFGLLFLVNEF